MLAITRSTESRRRWLQERYSIKNIEALFFEVRCDDTDLIMSDTLNVKTTSTLMLTMRNMAAEVPDEIGTGADAWMEGASGLGRMCIYFGETYSG